MIKVRPHRVLIICIISALSVLFLVNFKNSHGTSRLILTHHATGVSLGRKIQKIFLGSKESKLYYFMSRYRNIDTFAFGLGLTGLSSQYTHVLHFVRNPFAIIYSGYIRHKTSASEEWLRCPLEIQRTQVHCAFLLYTWPPLITAYKAIAYARLHLNGKNIGLKGVANNKAYLYPDPTGHSYQSYLLLLSPFEGIALEYLRSKEHVIEPMHRDVEYISKRQTENLLKNPFNAKVARRIRQLNESYAVIKPSHVKWDDRVREHQFEHFVSESYRNLCLEDITELDHNGTVTNPRSSTFVIAQALGIRGLTWRDMSHFHLWINLKQGILTYFESMNYT